MRQPLALLAFVAAAAAGLLLGPTTMSPAKAGIVLTHPVQFAVPDVKDGCKAHGGVRADPCVLTFTASNPGPFVVTIRTPQGNGSFVETDTCASRGIATVTAQGSDQFLVSAGPYAGTCVAHFKWYNSQGKKIGFAHLRITNNL